MTEATTPPSHSSSGPPEIATYFETMDLGTAQAITDAYVPTRPAALRRFQERWAASGRAPLAGTLTEADELQHWYHHAVWGDVQAE